MAAQQVGSGAVRSRLLEAGMQALGESGDESAVTLRGVARVAGIAAPSVYHHFPNQQALVAEVVAETFRQFEKVLVEAIESQREPARRIEAGLSAYLSYAARHPGGYRTIFSRDRPSRLPEVGEAAERLYALIAGELAALAGDVPGSRRSQDRTMWLWIELHGVADLRASHPRFPWPEESDLVEQLLRRVGLPS